MAACSINELLNSGRCFGHLMAGQVMAVELALLCKILQVNNAMATCDVQSLVSKANCFMCLTPTQAGAVRLQLLCEILHGGGAGASCIVCVAAGGAPVDPAPCDCSIAYNQLGQFWFWQYLNATWVPFIV
jgi:hypothetical protein